MAAPCETDFGGQDGFTDLLDADIFVFIPPTGVFTGGDLATAPIPPGATAVILQASVTAGGTDGAVFLFTETFDDVDLNSTPGSGGFTLHPGESFISEIIELDPAAIQWTYYAEVGATGGGDVINSVTVRADFFCGGATPTVPGQVRMAGAYTSLSGGSVPVALSHGRSYAMIIGA